MIEAYILYIFAYLGIGILVFLLGLFIIMRGVYLEITDKLPFNKEVYKSKLKNLDIYPAVYFTILFWPAFLIFLIANIFLKGIICIRERGINFFISKLEEYDKNKYPEKYV